MKPLLSMVLVSIVLILTHYSALAQQVTKEIGGIRQEVRVDENTKVFDKTTGKQVLYQEYQQFMKNDPYGYHLEPAINEYGQAGSYTIRTTTAEERATHQFNDMDPALQPKVGEPMPEFIMKGLDDKVYRSTELKGHVIVLSFWISLSKPFWNPNKAKAFSDALRPYQSETGPVSLGILMEPKESIVKVMATETLPFIPIPNSYGFNLKFNVIASPSFIIVDRTGNVAAFIERANYDQLQQVLQTVSR